MLLTRRAIGPRGHWRDRMIILRVCWKAKCKCPITNPTLHHPLSPPQVPSFDWNSATKTGGRVHVVCIAKHVGCTVVLLHGANLQVLLSLWQCIICGFVILKCFDLGLVSKTMRLMCIICTFCDGPHPPVVCGGR